MGVDVYIGISLHDKTDIPDNNSLVEGEFRQVEHYWAEGAPLIDAILSSLTRYYGKGYERGPWPQIHALLLETLMHPNVAKVWYWGDNVDPDENAEIDLDWLGEMSRYYVEFGHLPYRGSKV